MKKTSFKIAIIALLIVGGFNVNHTFAIDTETSANISINGVISNFAVPTGLGGFGAWSLQEHKPLFTSLGNLTSGAGNPCSTQASLNAEGLDMDTFASGDGTYYLYFPPCGSLTTGYYTTFLRRGGLWYTTTDVSNSTETRFITPYTSPTNGVTYTSTSTTFSFDYYFNDTTSFSQYNKVALNITNVNTGVQLEGWGSTAIIASGLNHYTFTIGLQDGKSYIWRPFMYKDASSTPLFGPLGNFSISSTSQAVCYSTDIFQCNPAYASTTAGTIDLTNITSLPNYVLNKVPFAYFFQVKDAIMAGINATSSTITTITYDWRFNNATTTFTLLSPTVLDTFLSTTTRNLLRNIALTLLVLGFIFGLYEEAKKLKII